MILTSSHNKLFTAKFRIDIELRGKEKTTFNILLLKVVYSSKCFMVK